MGRLDRCEASPASMLTRRDRRNEYRRNRGHWECYWNGCMIHPGSPCSFLHRLARHRRVIVTLVLFRGSSRCCMPRPVWRVPWSLSSVRPWSEDLALIVWLVASPWRVGGATCWSAFGRCNTRNVSLALQFSHI